MLFSRRSTLDLLSFVILCSFGLSQLVQPSTAAVLSIDYGSEWFKIGAAYPRKGQSPFSIVLNEFSKRKTQPAVAFTNGDRLLGEEAVGILGRYPERVYLHMRDLLGKPFSEASKYLKQHYLSYDLVEDPERGVAMIKSHDGKYTFTIEELVASILGYMRDLGEAHVKSSIKDIVLSVPPFFGPTQRQALLDAAQIAGLNVMTLFNEHSGAALQYGNDNYKDLAGGSRNVLLYDIGASSLSVAMVHFSSYTVKEYGAFGPNVSYTQFHVKSVQWDPEIGGRMMESRLIEHFADEFNKKNGNKFDIRTSPKAIAKLRKEVKRTKEILSANKEAPINVEGLHHDIDFRSAITRDKFEELCSDIWDRALEPVKAVLKNANMTMKDVDAFEVIGGASRVPKLRTTLNGFLRDRDIDRHLDADEATALGASLLAANLSDSFKLSRMLGIVDVTTYGYTMELEGISPGVAKPEQALFARLRKLPEKSRVAKVTRALEDQKDDFRVRIVYDGDLPPGILSREVATFEVTGVHNATAKYSTRNTSSPFKTSMHFTLSRSGTVTLDRAEISVEISEWVDVPVEVPLVINATAGGNDTSANDTTTSGTAKEGSQQQKAASADATSDDSADMDEAEASTPPEDDKEEGDSAQPSSEDGDSAKTEGESPPSDKGKEKSGKKEASSSPPPPQMVKKLRKRTIRVTLGLQDVTAGPGRRMSKEAIQGAVQRLAEMRARDKQKRETEAAKNALEAYIYDTREKLESLPNVEKVSTEAQRDALRAEMTEAEDWLYEDGEHASVADFRKRLSGMKSTGDLIFFRVSEMDARPAAVAEARKWMADARGTLADMPDKKPWINETLIAEVLLRVEDFAKWLEEKEAEQGKKKLTEEPAFSSADVQRKLGATKEKMTRLSKIPKPKPKPSPKATAKNTTENGTQETVKTDEAEKADDKVGPEKIVLETEEGEAKKAGHDEL